jgi:hypothetical protein
MIRGRILARLLFVGAAVAVAACASAGVRIERTHLGDIETGSQSQAQIREWFGEPYSQTVGLTGHPSGCVERWTYEFAKAQGFGKVTYSETLVIDFDAKGMVCDHAFNQTGSD